MNKLQATKIITKNLFDSYLIPLTFFKKSTFIPLTFFKNNAFIPLAFFKNNHNLLISS